MLPPIVIQIGLFLLSLSLLIVLHEFGHYITARWFKVRVIKFYLFFDFLFPMPDVLKGSIFKKKIGDTEYGIGWFPLGGYVQMAGIMDESMDAEALKEPVKPDEFRAKPAWQRLIILLGGIIVNVILAIVIYAGMLFHYGEKVMPVENMPHGLYASEKAQQFGLESGDIITYVEDKKVEKVGQETMLILINKAEEVTVLRNGETKKLTIPDGFYKGFIKELKDNVFISPIAFPIVDNLPETSNYKAAGGLVGDQIIAIDSNEINYFQDIKPHLLCKGEAGEMVNIQVLRDTDTVAFDVKVAEGDLIGIGVDYSLDVDTIHYSFGEALIGGVRKSIHTLDIYIDQFSLMFDRDIQGWKSIGGFGAIGGLFPKTVDWEEFWNLTAFLSIMLAFLNLLPIPALDGGHALFTVYEMIFRRPPNQRFMEIAQMVGMVILLALVLLANGNDLFKWLFPAAGPCG